MNNDNFYIFLHAVKMTVVKMPTETFIVSKYRDGSRQYGIPHGLVLTECVALCSGSRAEIGVSASVSASRQSFPQVEVSWAVSEVG